MRLTFLCMQDIESSSGLGRYFPLAKALISKRHEVTLCMLHPDFNNLKEKKIKKGGVDIIYCGQMMVRKSGQSKEYFSKKQLIKIAFKSIYGLYKQARLVKTDLYILCKPQPVNSLAMLMLRKPFILDCDDYEAESNKLNRLEKRIFVFFENYMPKKASAITTNTTFSIFRMIKEGTDGNKIFYMPNGVDPKRFSKIDKNLHEKLKKKYGLKIVLYCGSLSIGSGHALDMLLDAFHDIDAKLLLVGTGEDREFLREEIKKRKLKNVYIIGRVHPDLIPTYIKAANVTVEPAFNTLAALGRSPLKIFESIQMDTPIISSNVGDRGDWVGSGGFVVEPTSQGLAIGIKTFFNNPLTFRFDHKKEYHWSKLSEAMEEAILCYLKGS